MPRPRGEVRTRHLTTEERQRVRTLYIDGHLTKKEVERVTGYTPSQIRTAIKAESAQVKPRSGRPVTKPRDPKNPPRKRIRKRPPPKPLNPPTTQPGEVGPPGPPILDNPAADASLSSKTAAAIEMPGHANGGGTSDVQGFRPVNGPRTAVPDRARKRTASQSEGLDAQQAPPAKRPQPDVAVPPLVGAEEAEVVEEGQSEEDEEQGEGQDEGQDEKQDEEQNERQAEGQADAQESVNDGGTEQQSPNSVIDLTGSADIASGLPQYHQPTLLRKVHLVWELKESTPKNAPPAQPRIAGVFASSSSAIDRIAQLESSSRPGPQSRCWLEEQAVLY